jgi:NaMN:DMB phosphoribosyltransferase
MLVPLLALIPLLVLPAIRATPAPTVAIPATPVKRQDTPTVSVKFALTSTMILDVNPNGPEILFYGPTEFDNLPVESGVAYPVAETIEVFSISGTQVSVVAQVSWIQPGVQVQCS